VGWLASRFGPRIWSLVFVIGLLAVFAPGARLSSDNSDIEAWLNPNFSIDSYALALLTAAAFSRPPLTVPSTALLPRLRPMFWLALSAFLLTAARSATYTVNISKRTGITIGAVLGAAIPLICLITALSIPRHQVITPWRAKHKWSRGALVGAWGLLLAASLVVKIRYADVPWDALKEPRIRLSFGDVYAIALAPVMCFWATVTSFQSLRVLIVVLAGWLLLGFGLSHLHTGAGGGLPAAAWQMEWQGSTLGMTVLDCVSGALLGTVLSSFWTQRNTAPLRNWRTPAALAAVLIIEFFGPLLFSHRFFGLSCSIVILGGVAFIAGLVWRGRGLIVPLIIGLCLMVTWVAFDPDLSPELVATDLIQVGAVTFTFAFFGMLSNRYDAAREKVAPDAGGKSAVLVTTVETGADG
jgi:hypothetical protein